MVDGFLRSKKPNSEAKKSTNHLPTKRPPNRKEENQTYLRIIRKANSNVYELCIPIFLICESSCEEGNFLLASKKTPSQPNKLG